MEYYPAHKESDGQGSGIFTYIRPDVACVCVSGDVSGDVSGCDGAITNNRAFDGDTVYHDGSTVTGIVARSPALDCIAGVLHVTSMKLHGYTKRGLPIYKFTPLSWRYPSFMVSSSISNARVDVYALVAFSEWTTRQRYPSGRCINILGPVTDRHATDQALLHKSGLYIRKYRDVGQIEVEPAHEPEGTRTRHTAETILTIDPDGSTDRDDAFHIGPDGLIYVHIADVDAYFPAGGPYEHELERRAASVYAADRVYHMLPEKYATDTISLATGGDKLAITVVLGCRDGKLLGLRHYPSLVRVTRCLTYDEAQECCRPCTDDPVCCAVYGLSQLVGCTDTHKMIERIMVATNAYVGATTYAMGCALLRVQPRLPSLASMPDIIRGRVSKVSAQYVLASPHDGRDTYHSSLDLDKYSQFTSPMRRLGDLYVQRMLKHGHHPKVVSLERHNRYYRDKNIVQLSEGRLGRTEGYIIGYCSRRNAVDVYLPEYNMEYSYQLYNHLYLQCYRVDNLEDSLVILTCGEDLDRSITVPKYRPIDIELVAGPKDGCLRDRVIMRIPAVTTFLQL